MTTTAQAANAAWEALLVAHARWMKQFAAEDIWGEVSMREYDVLYTLSKCPDPIRLGELHQHVLLSQPALSRMVDRLTERGFVARDVDPSDRRGVHLSLTAAGREVQRAVGRRHGRSVTAALAGALAPEELAQLEALASRLAAHADAAAGSPIPLPTSKVPS